MLQPKHRSRPTDEWIDAPLACALLGVRPQTLYAYVSRKRIRARADATDRRKSLYARTDVEELARRHARPRARAAVAQAAIRWGDPVLTTSISEVRDGVIWLRGHAMEDCAETMSFEEVAAHLCGVARIPFAPAAPLPAQGTPFSRAMTCLSAEIGAFVNMQGRPADDIAEDAGRLIGLVSRAIIGDTGSGLLHERIARAWGLDPEGAGIMRRALVLLSEHELNPSTFAVRVCASTGVSLPAALLAGMAALSGPRHGGVSDLTARALNAAATGALPEFLASAGPSSPYEYGFGHPLYPDGDPRAKHLLRRLPVRAPARRAVRTLSAHLGIPPNIDAALAAISSHYGCPPHSASTIFALGRLAGWIAHAIEQVQSGEIIRPRARYVAQAPA